MITYFKNRTNFKIYLREIANAKNKPLYIMEAITTIAAVYFLTVGILYNDKPCTTSGICLVLFIIGLAIRIAINCSQIKKEISKTFEDYDIIESTIRCENNVFIITGITNAISFNFKKTDIKRVIKCKHTILVQVNSFMIFFPFQDDIYNMLTSENHGI